MLLAVKTGSHDNQQEVARYHAQERGRLDSAPEMQFTKSRMRPDNALQASEEVRTRDDIDDPHQGDAVNYASEKHMLPRDRAEDRAAEKAHDCTDNKPSFKALTQGEK